MRRFGILLLDAQMETVEPQARWTRFRRFWIAQGVSEFGTGVTMTVIPIIAVALLGVRPATLGLITAAGMIGGVFLRPLAGWWADRSPRLLPRLIVINLLLAGTSAFVPALWLVGHLSLGTLTAALIAHVALSAAAATLIVPAIPRLVREDQLLRANGRMQATAAASQVGGPAIAGLLLLIVSPPMAMLADAVSFVFCAFATWTMITSETQASPRTEATSKQAERSPRDGGVVTKLRERSHLLLYLVTLCACGGIGAALLPIFAIRVLNLSGATLSLLLAAGAGGGVLGGASIRWVSARLPENRLLVVAGVLAAVSFVGLLPARPGFIGAVLVAAFELLGGLAAVLAVTVSVTDFQRLLPPQLMGRGLAWVGTLCAAGTAAGAASSGILAELIGQRGAFVVAVGLGAAAAAIVGAHGSTESLGQRQRLPRAER